MKLYRVFSFYKIFFSVLFFAFLLILGCNKNKSQEEINSSAEIDSVIVRSEEVYRNFCSGCHGPEMRTFVDRRKWKWGNSPDELYQSIAQGRGDGGMPAFGESFSDQLIKDLVTAIRYKIERLDEYESEDTVPVSGVFESNEFKFKLEFVADGFESPWGMVFLPGGTMLVTDKSGELWRLNGEEKTEIDGVPEVVFKGQGGLMDIELHPDFDNNNILYLSYSKLNEDDDELATTAVSRFVLDGENLTNGELIFEALPYYDTRHHYGCRLEFDDEGYLYITVGDRGKRDINPQDLSLYPGKVHRVNDDGSIPDDNPFVSQENAVASIYSYGHRNPQGMIKNPFTGEIWTHEHGPRGGDEMNIIRKGANYGWPVISYGINYDGSIFTNLTAKEGMKQPLHYWTPSIAPCGMDFVEGDKYPGWEGDLLVASLRFKYLSLCNIEGSDVVSEEKLLQGIGRVRNVKQGPDGIIYVAFERPGRIFKIIPVN